MIGQLGERPGRVVARDQVLDDRRVHDGAAVRNPAHRVEQRLGLADAVLEQVSPPGLPVLDQLQRIRQVEILGEHEHAHLGMGAADLLGGLEPLGRARRRHPDVDHRHVRPVALDLPVQRVGVAREGRDVDAALAQQGGDTVAQERGVVGDDDPQRPPLALRPPSSEHEVAAAQPPELDLTGILEPDLVLEVLVCLRQLAHDPGDEDLGALRHARDARRLDDGPAVQVIGAHRRLARVEPHPHPQVRGAFERQRALDVDGTAQRLACAGEGDEMAVADRLDQGSAVIGDRLIEQGLVVGQRAQPPGLAHALEHRRRPLDVGEQNRDRRPWHRHIVTDPRARRESLRGVARKSPAG